MNIQSNCAATSYILLVLRGTPHITASWFSEYPDHRYGMAYTKKTLLPCNQRWNHELADLQELTATLQFLHEVNATGHMKQCSLCSRSLASLSLPLILTMICPECDSTTVFSGSWQQLTTPATNSAPEQVTACKQAVDLQAHRLQVVRDSLPR